LVESPRTGLRLRGLKTKRTLFMPQNIPNIVKVVPVRKNGYILELQVPAPGQPVANAYAQVGAPRSSVAAPANEMPQQAIQEQIKEQETSNFNLRSFFKR
jgi:hypothetical protein